MPVFKFAITAPATMTAQVSVEADSIEEAQEIAQRPSFYQDPDNAHFVFDEENVVDDVYLPDENDYEVEGDENDAVEDASDAPSGWSHAG